MSVEFRTEWTTEGHDHLSATGPSPHRRVFGSAEDAVAFGRLLIAALTQRGAMVRVVRIDHAVFDLDSSYRCYINQGIGLDGRPWSVEPDIAIPGESNTLASAANPWEARDPMQRGSNVANCHPAGE